MDKDVKKVEKKVKKLTFSEYVVKAGIGNLTMKEKEVKVFKIHTLNKWGVNSPLFYMGLIALYEKWSKIDFLDLAKDTLLEMDEFIADLNRKQLGEKGIRPDGSDISPEYKTITKEIKSDKSGLSGVIEHVTLYDKGSFHKSIFTSIIGDELILDATDSKTNDLLEKYGEVLGLTKENISILQEEFRPKYIANIERALQ